MTDSYVCSKCHVRGVKLWRGYQTSVSLTCVRCSSESDVEPFAFLDHPAIGWHVPAVPTEDGSEYWGFGSVPDDRVVWWYDLPTYGDDDALEIQCLRNIGRKHLAMYLSTAGMWLKEWKRRNELESTLRRMGEPC